MRESGYYPPGAEFDPNAPYNEVEQPEREYEVEAVYELRRRGMVTTDDYDEDGNVLVSTSALWHVQHMTPPELIAECKRLAVERLQAYGDGVPGRVTRRLRHIIAECEDWELSYEEYE